MLTADWGALGRLGQSRYEDDGAEDNFRRKTGKGPGCDHAADYEQQKRFHRFPFDWGPLLIMSIVTVGIECLLVK